MSCNTESWANGTLDQAIDMLAKRAAVARVLRTKQADMGETFNNGLSALQRQVELNPALAATLGGAALGAGAGGLSSLAADPERRHTGRSMLTGAIAGAGVGGGGYMASRMIPQIEAGMKSKNDTSFAAGGGTRSINPEAIQKNPQVIAEIEKLRTKSLPTQAAQGSWDFAKNYASNHPILSMIMGADVASNTLGTTAGWMSGLPGMRGNHLGQGINAMDGKAPNAEALKAYAQEKGKSGLTELLRKARNVGSKGTVDIPGIGKTPSTVNIGVDAINDLYNQGGGGVRAGGLQSIQDILDSFRTGGDTTVEQGTAATRGRWTGMDATGGAQPGMFNKLLRTFESRPGAKSLMGKLGPRAALYLGVPAAQAYAGTLSQESQNNQRLEQLIQQLSSPAGK